MSLNLNSIHLFNESNRIHLFIKGINFFKSKPIYFDSNRIRLMNPDPNCHP